MKSTRRLAAIMFTDMVGFSALTYQDELLSKEIVDEHREIIRQFIRAHNGNENQTTGDGFLIEFPSAVDAVQCAIEVQTYFHEKSKHLTLDRKIQIRIGIHLGDIIIEGTQFHSNGVNIAARIEPMAPPGGICISRQVFDQVASHIQAVNFKNLGHREIKNIKSEVDVYNLIMPWQQKNTEQAIFKKILKSHSKIQRLSLNGSLAGSFFIATFAFLFWLGVSSLNWDQSEISDPARGPASTYSE